MFACVGVRCVVHYLCVTVTRIERPPSFRTTSPLTMPAFSTLLSIQDSVTGYVVARASHIRRLLMRGGLDQAQDIVHTRAARCVKTFFLSLPLADANTVFAALCTTTRSVSTFALQCCVWLQSRISTRVYILRIGTWILGSLVSIFYFE